MMRGQSGGAEGTAGVRSRTVTLMVIIGVTFGIYLIYLFNMQVVNNVVYQKRATAIATRVVDIPAQRGEIFDRKNNVPLVTNKPSFAVDVIPADAQKLGLNRVLQRLSKVLKVTPKVLASRIPTGWRYSYHAVEVQSKVPFSTITYIAEHIGRYPGVIQKPLNRVSHRRGRPRWLNDSRVQRQWSPI